MHTLALLGEAEDVGAEDLVDGEGDSMEDAIRQTLLPEAEQLFREHFNDIITLGEALRKKGRGGRLDYAECKELLGLSMDARPQDDATAAAAVGGQ